MNADLRRRFATATGLLSLAMLAASAANYALNLGLARLLNAAEFGDATLMVTLLLGLTAAGVALQLVTARVVGPRPVEATAAIRAQLARRAGRAGVIVAVVMAAGAPWLQGLFKTGSALPFVALAVGLPIYLVQSVDRGVLQGRLQFGRLAASFAAEAAVRFGGGLALVAVGFGVTGATAALSLSFVGSWWAMRGGGGQAISSPVAPAVGRSELSAASRATVLLLIGQIIINNGDVVWAKHILDAETAGAYAAIALVGRAVFFCSWAVANAAFPLAGADDDNAVLKMGIAIVAGMSALAVAAIVVIGDRLGPLLFGSALGEIPALFAPYAVATALFAVANLVATVDVARGRMDTALTVLGGGILQTVLLVRFGTSPATLVDAQLVAMTLLLAATLLVHRFAGAGRAADARRVAPATA